MKRIFAYLMTLAILASTLTAPVSAFNPFKGKGQSSSESSVGSPAAEDAKSSSAAEDAKKGSSAAEDAKGSSTAEDAKKGSSAAAEDVKGSSAAGAAPVKEVSSSVASYPPDFADQLKSQGVYMLNLDSGMTVWQRNSQTRMYPAFLTKIVTCIVALEEVEDPTTETTDLKMYIQNYLYNLNGAPWGGILPGETLTIKDLLYAMMLQSANEAAMMIADYVGDGNIEEYFTELMNKKVREIGAMNTHFVNPTGLHDEGNYTTPYDMALIIQYAMDNPDFVKIVTAREYTSKPTNKHENGITWYSNNQMQLPTSSYYYEGCKGIMAGSLDGQNIRNFASVASRDGYTYLLVVMGAPIRDAEGATYGNPTTGEVTNLAWIEAAQLYDWAFKTFRVKTLMNVGEEISQVGVRLSWEKDTVKLLAKEKFATLVPNEITVDDVQPEVIIENSVLEPVKGGKKGDTIECINAPVEKGAEIGYVKLMLQGEEVGRIPLVAAENIEQSMALTYLDKVKQFFNTFLFKFVLTFVIVIILLYIVLMIIRNHNKRRYKARRKHPPVK